MAGYPDDPDGGGGSGPLDVVFEPKATGPKKSLVAKDGQTYIGNKRVNAVFGAKDVTDYRVYPSPIVVASASAIDFIHVPIISDNGGYVILAADGLRSFAELKKADNYKNFLSAVTMFGVGYAADVMALIDFANGDIIVFGRGASDWKAAIVKWNGAGAPTFVTSPAFNLRTPTRVNPAGGNATFSDLYSLTAKKIANNILDLRIAGQTIDAQDNRSIFTTTIQTNATNTSIAAATALTLTINGGVILYEAKFAPDAANTLTINDFTNVYYVTPSNTLGYLGTMANQIARIWSIRDETKQNSTVTYAVDIVGNVARIATDFVADFLNYGRPPGSTISVPFGLTSNAANQLVGGFNGSVNGKINTFGFILTDSVAMDPGPILDAGQIRALLNSPNFLKLLNGPRPPQEIVLQKKTNSNYPFAVAGSLVVSPAASDWDILYNYNAEEPWATWGSSGLVQIRRSSLDYIMDLIFKWNGYGGGAWAGNASTFAFMTMQTGGGVTSETDTGDSSHMTGALKIGNGQDDLNSGDGNRRFKETISDVGDLNNNLGLFLAAGIPAEFNLNMLSQIRIILRDPPVLYL